MSSWPKSLWAVLGFELFEPVLADKLKVAESVAPKNKAKNLGNKIVQLFAFFQILKLIALGTGGNVFVHRARFHLTTSI
jgi:hypothetical protein